MEVIRYALVLDSDMTFDGDLRVFKAILGSKYTLTYAIRADGGVAKCTVALRDGRNNIGKLNRDGTMELNAEKAVFWSRGFISGDREALACPARTKGRDR